MRNGKIDFLRFIFALFIMFLHYKWRPVISAAGVSLELGHNGGWGVVFFFILSGYLLHKSISKRTGFSGAELAAHNRQILVHKYFHYIQWYFPAFVLCVLLDACQRGIPAAIKGSVYSIQNLFLLGSLGFSSDAESMGYYVGASWFISALFLAQIIMIPLMLKNYDAWVYVISPIIFIFLLFITIRGYGNEVTNAMYHMIFGGFCYELSVRLDSVDFSKGIENLMRTVEVAIFAACAVYMCIEPPESAQWGMFFIVGLGIVLAFSRHTEYGFYSKPIFSYLGRLSFPLYLLHIQVLHWADFIIDSTVWGGNAIPDYVKYPILYLTAIAVAMIAMWISDIVMRKIINVTP